MRKSRILAFMGFLLLLLVVTIGYGVFKSATHETKTADRIHVDRPEQLMGAEKISTSKRDSIVAFAIQFIGTPYVYGSCNADGFDCSGFVYFVFQHFDIEVPRSSSEYKDFGEVVPIQKVKKGDILVFLSPTSNVIGHIGLVTNPKGMETVFIHSSSGKEMQVMYSSLKQEGYKKRFVKAVRVL